MTIHATMLTCAVLRRKTVALLRSKKSALLRRKTRAVLRARTCVLFSANAKAVAFGRHHTVPLAAVGRPPYRLV